MDLCSTSEKNAVKKRDTEGELKWTWTCGGT